MAKFTKFNIREKDNKKEQNKKNIIILSIIFLVALLAIASAFFVKSKIESKKIAEKANKTEKERIPQEVFDVYQLVRDVNCNGALTWNIQTNEELMVENMSEKILQNLIFRKLKLNGLLTNNLTYENYELTARELFDSNTKIPKKIEQFQYDGYIYNYKKEKMTRRRDICLKGTTYISIIDKYLYQDNKNILNIYTKVGYVEDNILYDVYGNVLIKYDKSQKDEQLKKGTEYKYTFIKMQENYFLKSVTLLSTIKIPEIIEFETTQ